MAKNNNHLQKIYNRDYFFAGKGWGDGYPDYDNFAELKKHPWGFMVERILREKKQGKILDIGCALGHFLGFLPASFEKYGTDISEFAVETAGKRFPGVSYRVGDISEKKPFNDKFEVITAFDVLEHTLNLRGALKNIHSMLDDQGLFFAAVPVASRVHHLLAFFGKSFLTTMDSHLTLTTAKAWREIILPEHFEIVEEFPITWKGKHYPKIDLFQVFVMRKR